VCANAVRTVYTLKLLSQRFQPLPSSLPPKTRIYRPKCKICLMLMKHSSKTQKQGRTQSTGRRCVTFDVFRPTVEYQNNKASRVWKQNYFLCRHSPNPVSATSVLLFLDHKHLDTHTHTQSVGLLWMGDQLVTESANYAARYRHNRGAPMRSSGFEPAIPARERPQTHALDRAVTGSAL